MRTNRLLLELPNLCDRCKQCNSRLIQTSEKYAACPVGCGKLVNIDSVRQSRKNSQEINELLKKLHGLGCDIRKLKSKERNRV